MIMTSEKNGHKSAFIISPLPILSDCKAELLTFKPHTSPLGRRLMPSLVEMCHALHPVHKGYLSCVKCLFLQPIEYCR